MTTHPIIRQTPTRVMYKFPRTLCIHRIFWQMDPMEIYMAVKEPNCITKCCYLHTKSQSLSSAQGNMSSIGLKKCIYPLPIISKGHLRTLLETMKSHLLCLESFLQRGQLILELKHLY